MARTPAAAAARTRAQPDDIPYDAADPMVLEAYGVLHANLSPTLRDGEGRVVTVVGHDQGVGKSSVVQGLATA